MKLKNLLYITLLGISLILTGCNSNPVVDNNKLKKDEEKNYVLDQKKVFVNYDKLNSFKVGDSLESILKLDSRIKNQIEVVKLNSGEKTTESNKLLSLYTKLDGNMGSVFFKFKEDKIISIMQNYNLSDDLAEKMFIKFKDNYNKEKGKYISYQETKPDRKSKDYTEQYTWEDKDIYYNLVIYNGENGYKILAILENSKETR